MIDPFNIYQSLLDLEPDNFLLEEPVNIKVTRSGFWELKGKHSIPISNFILRLTSFNSIKISQPILPIESEILPYFMSVLSEVNDNLDGSIYMKSFGEVYIITYSCHVPISEGGSPNSYLSKGIELMEQEVISIKGELNSVLLTMDSFSRIINGNNDNDNKNKSIEDRYNSLLDKERDEGNEEKDKD